MRSNFVNIFVHVPPNMPLFCSSHWFLAIICFPGLKEVKTVHYIPKPSELPDSNSTSDIGDNEKIVNNSADSELPPTTPEDTSEETPSSQLETNNEDIEGENGQGNTTTSQADETDGVAMDTTSSEKDKEGSIKSNDEVNSVNQDTEMPMVCFFLHFFAIIKESLV